MGALLAMKNPIRHTIPAAACAVLLGCGTNSEVQAVRDLGDATRAVAIRPLQRAPSNPQLTITPDILAQIGQPLIIATTDDYAAGYIAVQENRGYWQWRTDAGQGLTFRDGLLTATRGYGDDLMNTDFDLDRNTLRTASPGDFVRIHRHLAADTTIYLRSFRCRLSQGGSEQIVQAGKSITARKVIEDCVGANTRTTNSYWFSGSGALLKARQWVSDGVGYMTLDYYNGA